jgi:hypothetical protein
VTGFVIGRRKVRSVTEMVRSVTEPPWRSACPHGAPDARGTTLLDGSNGGVTPTSSHAHIHFWHTDQKFSKHAFLGGEYTLDDLRGADLSVVRDYCLVMSFRSLGDLDSPAGPIMRGVLQA